VLVCPGEHRVVGRGGRGTKRSNRRHPEEEELDHGMLLLEEEELDRLVLRVVHDEVDGGSAMIAGGGVPNLTVHLERGATQVQQCLHLDQWCAHVGIMQKTSSDRATCEGGKRDMLAKWKERFF
jgi:hypothetical protein